MHLFYSIADYFVNSTYEDNYPTTNIEAIACGTPVITYDTGGSPESAKMYGSIIEKGDIPNLAHKIEHSGKMQSATIEVDYLNTIAKYIEVYL